MKKELMKTFFLAFAAFLIATTSNSVANNRQQKSFDEEVACNDIWGLEKLVVQAKTPEDEPVPVNVKIQCSKKRTEPFVRNDDFKLDRTSNSMNRNF